MQATMVTLTNYNSGELLIAADSGPSVRLGREEANRLILHARMHSVADFVAAVPGLVKETAVSSLIVQTFEKAPTTTDRWNLKEKFARLRTLAKGFEPDVSEKVVENIVL